MTQPRTALPNLAPAALLTLAAALLMAVLALTGGPVTSLLPAAAGLTTWLTAVSTRGL